MKILGLGFTQHESSAALVVDGEVSSAIPRERVSRTKRDGSTWGAARLGLEIAIDYSVSANGLEWEGIDMAACYHYFHKSAEDFKQLLAAEGGLDIFSKPTISLPQHFAHACCAFHLSPFQEAAILVADVAGGPVELIADNCEGPEAHDIAEGRTIVQYIDPHKADENSEYQDFYKFRDGQCSTLAKTVVRSNGIRAVYSLASRLLFDDGLDSEKIMGLSS